MPKHIGIVACSAEGAALCYRTICDEAPALMGRHMHPEITMHTHCLGEYMEYIYRDDWQGVADLMLSSADKLAKAGADFLICPDNTIHHAFDLVAPRSPLPWLHIVDEVAAEAKARGFRKLAITGTKYTMEGTVYQKKLPAAGFEYVVPDAAERARIDEIIFDELVNGIFTAESRTYFQQVIGRMSHEGCDAVVLGCTEIPLLIDDITSPLPTLDSTRILARAALRQRLAVISSLLACAALNAAIRSCVFITCTGKGSCEPSSRIGISLSNSGPECEPVNTMRTGWNRSLPLAPVFAFTSFMMALKRSGVMGDGSLSTCSANAASTSFAFGPPSTSALSANVSAAAASTRKIKPARSGSSSSLFTDGTSSATTLLNHARVCSSGFSGSNPGLDEVRLCQLLDSLRRTLS